MKQLSKVKVLPTFGRRYSDPQATGPDPFSYNTDKGLTLTKESARSAVFHNRQGRVTTPVNKELGPGTYPSRNNFGEGLSSLKIRSRSPEKPVNPELGPGFYQIDKADKHVRVSSRAANFKHSGRP